MKKDFGFCLNIAALFAVAAVIVDRLHPLSGWIVWIAYAVMFAAVISNIVRNVRKR